MRAKSAGGAPLPATRVPESRLDDARRPCRPSDLIGHQFLPGSFAEFRSKLQTSAYPVVAERSIANHRPADPEPLGDGANTREVPVRGAVLAHANDLAEDVQLLDGVPVPLCDRDHVVKCTSERLARALTPGHNHGRIADKERTEPGLLWACPSSGRGCRALRGLLGRRAAGPWLARSHDGQAELLGHRDGHASSVDLPRLTDRPV
jgi:hypothetical protein